MLSGPTQRLSNVTAGPGGVMTDEVGVITGDLTLCTELAPDGTVVHRVQYQGADEWYVMSGTAAPLPAGSDLDAVHAEAVARIQAGGGSGEPGG
jgi:hypothetical protein